LIYQNQSTKMTDIYSSINV